MKRFYLSVFFTLMLLSLLSACGGPKEPPVTEDGDLILAEYRGEVITQSDLEQARQSAAAIGTESTAADREIVERKLRSAVLQDEAEKRGITASSDEVSEFLQATLYASYDMLEGKAMIDSYCEQMGLTFEEYEEQNRQAAPGTILQGKLEESIVEEYCQKRGLEFDGMNLTDEMREALNKELDAIWQKAQKEITYYI